MSVSLRRGGAADATTLGEICYSAFKAIAEAHNFPPDFPSPDAAAALLAGLIKHDGFFDVVAELDGKIVGSNFLDERNPIAGVGPITVAPTLQNSGAGRALMPAVLRRSEERGFTGIRLLQAAYHSRTLALYLKLGFEARELLACFQGPAVGKVVAGHSVRTATERDLAPCNHLCLRGDRQSDDRTARRPGDDRLLPNDCDFSATAVRPIFSRPCGMDACGGSGDVRPGGWTCHAIRADRLDLP